LSEIDQSKAKLFTTDFSFLKKKLFRVIQNRNGCFERGMDPFKYGQDIARSSTHTKFKNGENILLGFQTTAAQTQVLLSDNAKNRPF